MSDIPGRTRGRPRRNQGTLADVRIEDGELEDELETILECSEAAADHRKAAKRIRELMLERHRDKINSEGGVIVGNFRFKPRAGTVEAKTSTVKRKAGFIWSPLQVERTDDPVAGPPAA